MTLKKFNLINTKDILIAKVNNTNPRLGPLITKRKSYRVLSACPKTYHNIITFETDGKPETWTTYKHKRVRNLGKLLKIKKSP